MSLRIQVLAIPVIWNMAEWKVKMGTKNWAKMRFIFGWKNDLFLIGTGTYKFASGTKYCGEMKDGKFHGTGVLHMTTGAKMDGEWEHGKMIKGKLTFADGLEFEDSDDWDFCQPTDR